MEQIIDYLIVERTPDGSKALRRFTDRTVAGEAYEQEKREYEGERSIVLLERVWNLICTTPLAAS